MMNKISLTGLRARGTHGVLEHEKIEPQDFVVDVDMWLDASAAARNDDVAHTVSYAEVADAIVEIIEGEHADLIETLADRIVRRLSVFPVDGLSVTVHKPNAPIPYQFEDVSVTFEWWRLPDTDTCEVVISLGSNLDDPRAHVREAIEQIGDSFEVLAVSSLYETAPQLAEGQQPQPAYVNATMKVRASADLEAVLLNLQEIEQAHGRVRDERWGARTLDLDIISAGGLSTDGPLLTVPHPRAHERRFVLEPWLEIDPHATLGGRAVSDLVDELPEQSVKRLD